jgi:hypothetical protein
MLNIENIIWCIIHPAIVYVCEAWCFFHSVNTDSASLGAALRSAHGWFCNQQGEFVPFSCVYSGRMDRASLSMRLAVPFGDEEGNLELLNNYTLLVKKRLEIEQKLIKRFGRPEWRLLVKILGTTYSGIPGTRGTRHTRKHLLQDLELVMHMAVPVFLHTLYNVNQFKGVVCPPFLAACAREASDAA